MKNLNEIITTPALELTIADQLTLLMYIGGFIVCVFLLLVIALWCIDRKQRRRD